MMVRNYTSTLALTLVLTACGQSQEAPLGPEEGSAVLTAAAAAMSANKIEVAGTFAQTLITSIDVREAGPNTFISQTSEGTVSGTLNGTYEDDLRVTIHPNGTFTTQFTIKCSCNLAGEQGILDLVANDRGRVSGSGTATFAGQATIVAGTGGLADLKGVLKIEGTVDLASGLAEYEYHGLLH